MFARSSPTPFVVEHFDASPHSCPTSQHEKWVNRGFRRSPTVSRKPALTWGNASSRRAAKRPSGRFDSLQLQECSIRFGLSIVGAARCPFVASEDLACPLDGVFHSDAARLRAYPELEVLDAVVVLSSR